MWGEGQREAPNSVVHQVDQKARVLEEHALAAKLLLQLVLLVLSDRRQHLHLTIEVLAAPLEVASYQSWMDSFALAPQLEALIAGQKMAYDSPSVQQAVWRDCAQTVVFEPWAWALPSL